MKNITDYTLVVSWLRKPDTLIIKVKEKISEWWSPIGAPFTYEADFTMIWQALVKYEKI